MMALLIGIGMLGSPPTADAGFRLRIEDGSGTGVVITDGVGNAADDTITFNGMVGSFNVIVSAGIKTPNAFIAPNFFDAIDLNSLTVNTNGAGSIRFILEADDFNTAPNGAVIVRTEVGGTLTAPAGSTVSFTGWANPANLMPNLGPDAGSATSLPAVTNLPPAGSATAGPLTFGVGAYSGAAEATFVKNGNYSIFSSAVINFTGAGTVSFDHQTGSTPAPAALVMLLTGTPVLGAAGLYYRRKKAMA
jgi:hypothetical protein